MVSTASIVKCKGWELNSHFVEKGAVKEGAEVVVLKGSIRHRKYHDITFIPDWQGQCPADGVYKVVGFDEVENVVMISMISRPHVFASFVDFTFPCPNRVDDENNMVYPCGEERAPRPRKWGVVGAFCCDAHMLGRSTRKPKTKTPKTIGVVKTSPTKAPKAPKATPPKARRPRRFNAWQAEAVALAAVMASVNLE